MKDIRSPRLARLFGVLALLVACESTPKSSSTASVAPKEAAGSDDTSSTDCTELKRSQGPSEPCCPSHGKDACGANLFCAAFDGRKTPTCYVEGQQRGGEECADDSHCQSNECNTDVKKCVGLTVGDTCDSEAGCGEAAICLDQKCVLAEGAAQSPCDADNDCQNVRYNSMQGKGVCVRGRCGARNESDVEVPSECASRFATGDLQGFRVTCAACESDADCLSVESRKFERCMKGVCVHTCLNDDQCSFVCRTNGCARENAQFTCVEKFCR